MPLLSTVLAFLFGNPLGKLAAGAAGLAALVLAFSIQQQNVGAAKQAARQERTDAAVVKNARRAGELSRDPASSGVRDPNAVGQ